MGLKVLYVPHRHVSAEQVALLQQYEGRYEQAEGGSIPGYALVCSVHVLGATQHGARLHVWTVAQCIGVTPKGNCDRNGDNFTVGLTADLNGTRISDAKHDDGIDGTDLRADHAYYPRGLWNKENALLNQDGDADGLNLRKDTLRLAGCRATQPDD